MSDPDERPRRSDPTPAPSPAPSATPSTATGPSTAGGPSLLDPSRGPAGGAGGPQLTPSLLPRSTLLPSPSLLGPNRLSLGPQPSPLSLMDPSVYEGLRTRGLSVSTPWVRGAEQHFQFWFPILRDDVGLSPSQAAWLLNLGISSSIDREAARLAPTPADEFQAEIDAEHAAQGAFQTPIFTYDLFEF